ncbi:LacI family DNA-binding transcriptional regulator [Aquimarina brevivitae]|uniref:LacI family transcriptional regulator n=1 Tax=Aquimarina brevivitae TaxID=323412 RepID=A0A4Q7PIX0_9FLAO|nr:LacI family DNA-binding transcriptional regulator [Aquimarina brevivitae]RZS99780.1 LacI family transcriptional regulator [Aquimarina brevivitae]
MRKKVTLKQLARELNLSISTVSKSLKNDPEISEKTINRVHELAQFYNYKPNALAVSLKSNRTKTIGILLPEILNHFFAKALNGIEKEASARGYKILTCITNESYDKEVEYMEMLNHSSVDGFIIALSEETQIVNKYDHYEALKREKVPVVMFDRVWDQMDCDKVIVDDAEASRNAIQYLADSGCTNIAVITTIGDLNVAKLRIEGAHQSAEKNGLLLKGLTLKNATHAEEEIYNFLKNTAIDAVLGLDETSAAVTINSCHRLGYKIPEDVSVIGFSDGILSKYSYPKLSSISQHAEDLGAKAVTMLVDHIENTKDSYTPRTEVIKTSLILRDSTN